MEDRTPPSNAPPPAARSADRLRELHERARSALAAQRERMNQLESHLTAQLDSIAGALSEQLSSQADQADHAQRSSAEIDELRQELDRARATWNAEREQLSAGATEQHRLLVERQAELDAQEAELASARGTLDAARDELESRQQALDERAAQLNAQERELSRRHEELDSYSAECAVQQSRLTEAEGHLDARREELDAREAKCQSREEQLERDRGELTRSTESWQAERDALVAERDAATAARDTAAAERDSLATERDAAAAERHGLAEKHDKQAAEIHALRAEIAKLLGDFQQQLADQQNAWSEQRKSLEDERSAAEEKRDELAARLASVGTELEAARHQTDASGERDDVAQKFELALADVQRLRRRVTELEQDLASRPAADQKDSVELVHLRAERDALTERVAEFEQQSAPTVDADSAQEMADLQRRFELAVEDVRDLKKRNSRLEAELEAANARTAPAAASDVGSGSNWESLKRQMLASLEGERIDEDDDDRQEERATIEGTIRITDEVVANKDQEIAALQSQLAAAGDSQAAEDAAVRGLVDADEVIRQHRARTAQVENEMTEKLRAAELELSVERARIAREQAHLAELRAEVEAQQAMNEASGGTGGHAPKRRWLSKLGLSGEEEQK